MGYAVDIGIGGKKKKRAGGQLIFVILSHGQKRGRNRWAD